MAISAVINWFGRAKFEVPVMRPMTRVVEAPPADTGFADDPDAPTGYEPAWTPDRIATTDILWGDGFQFPGGEIETLRLAKPLGLSAASSLLLLGAGGGGSSQVLATRLGVWVNGFEADPVLAAAATERIARNNLGKRARIESWDPNVPVFRKRFFHHGLALEPLHGSQPELVLAAIGAALKGTGQLMMTELIADHPLNPSHPLIAAWARLEHRDPTTLPTEVAITRILGRLGFDVRVIEDISERHTHQAMMGWRAAVRMMENVRPSRREAMAYVREAELWLVRLQLFQQGQLRQVRWHAIGGGG